ncbi:Cilia- and flagella-associated protein 157 (Flagellar-associated protein 77) [Durusdinium trenchii]|uniref:Cilia- and flagella-associated protein 157 n=1 Tax=Durusdinium trenchii TaxID=1381693 RepID=A0ABP0NZK5_9DINO
MAEVSTMTLHAIVFSGKSFEISTRLTCPLWRLRRLIEECLGALVESRVARRGADRDVVLRLEGQRTVADAGLEDRAQHAKTGGSKWCDGDQLLVALRDGVACACATGGAGLCAAEAGRRSRLLGREPRIPEGRKAYGGDQPGTPCSAAWVDRAFAFVLPDGTVRHWPSHTPCASRSSTAPKRVGHAAFRRGDDVVKLCATSSAVAALLADGSVVTWGEGFFGGDSSAVQAQLDGVVDLCSSTGAFAARRSDGRVVAWGSEARADAFGIGAHMDDWGHVQDQLIDIIDLCASLSAFAALTLAFQPFVEGAVALTQPFPSKFKPRLLRTSSGTVVLWGDEEYGAQMDEVRALRKVWRLKASVGAFAAVKEDGSVVTWGDHYYGAFSGFVQDQLRDVEEEATSSAFAARTRGGRVITWGDAEAGGDSSASTRQSTLQIFWTPNTVWAPVIVSGAVQQQLQQVIRLCASVSAFAALRADGTVITWGHPDYGGTGPAASGLPSVSPVRRLWATSAAFAALRDDGRVITWGSAAAGGDSRGVEEPLGDGRRLGEFGEDGQGATSKCLRDQIESGQLISIAAETTSARPAPNEKHRLSGCTFSSYPKAGRTDSESVQEHFTLRKLQERVWRLEAENKELKAACLAPRGSSLRGQVQNSILNTQYTSQTETQADILRSDATSMLAQRAAAVSLSRIRLLMSCCALRLIIGFGPFQAQRKDNDIAKLKTQKEELQNQLDEVREFQRNKENMEQELAALKQQLADTKEEFQRKMSDMDRKKAMDMRTLSKDGDFEKKVEIEAAKLRDQLDSTTKRTIMENEQMFTELHFQSKETEKLMERNQSLLEENAQLRRNLVIHKDLENELARRTHLYQRLLKKMDQKTSTQGKSMESVMEQENPLTGLRECEGYSRRAEAKSVGMNISSEEYSRVQRQMEDHQSTLQMVRHEFAQYRRDHATLAQLQDQSTRLIISALYELKQQKDQAPFPPTTLGISREVNDNWGLGISFQKYDPEAEWQFTNMTPKQKEYFFRVLLEKLNSSMCAMCFPVGLELRSVCNVSITCFLLFPSPLHGCSFFSLSISKTHREMACQISVIGWVARGQL